MRYRVVKKFITGNLKGITITDESSVAFTPGETYSRTVLGGRYVVLSCDEVTETSELKTNFASGAEAVAYYLKRDYKAESPCFGEPTVMNGPAGEKIEIIHRGFLSWDVVNVMGTVQ